MAVSRLSETTLQNAFQKFNNVWDGRSAVGGMDTIGGITLTASASSITFSSIPQTYSHLQLRITARNTRVSGYNAGSLSGYFNGDTGANYKNHILYGDGGTVYSFADLASPYFNVTRCADNSVANVFGVSVTDILDYTNTNKNKTVRTLSGTVNSTQGEFNFYSGLWLNTAAITSLTIDSPTFSLMQHSSFALYGVK
jgi:hypothetical protein